MDRFQVLDYFRTAGMEEARDMLETATLLVRGRERTRQKPKKGPEKASISAPVPISPGVLRGGG